LLIAFSSGKELAAQVYVQARSLTVQQGLSDNRVTCFYQDKTGFIWIGTRNGLNRYDGLRIINFRPTAGNSISNEIINDIAEDSGGRIWVATMNGLNQYDPATNHWKVFLPDVKLSNEDIPSNLIWDIHIDNSDRVWIASDVREFCYYDIGSTKFTYYDWPQFVKNNTHFTNGSYNSIKRFVFKNETEVLLASNKALVSLNIKTKNFQYLAGNYRSDVHDLRYDSAVKKAYWTISKNKLLTWEENLSRFTETTPLLEAYPSQRFRMPGAKEIWMAAESGLIRIDTKENDVFLSQHVPQITGSLQPGGVAAVMQTGPINWVGTSNGISIYDRQHQTTSFLPLLPVSDKESSNYMGGVFYDESRELYFVCAAESSAVFTVNRTNGIIKKLITDADGKPFFHCNTIKADKENNIWLLTDNHVYRFDDKSQNFRLFPMPNKGEAVVFRDMTQDAEGNYWFGSFHKGLYCFQSKEKRFVLPKGKGFEDLPTITALHADHARRKVWIGTFSRGFYCYDLAAKKLTEFLETPEHPSYGALDLVHDITEDATGAIWAATQSGGLFRFIDNKPSGYEVKQFTMKTGLPDNSFIALTADKDSSLWAMSGSGIYQLNNQGELLANRVSNEQFRFSSYQSDVRFPHKIHYNVYGELLIGVGGGLLIQQTTLSREALPVSVVLTNVQVNDTSFSTSQWKKIGELSHDQNTLQFEFARLYYGAAQHTVQCRLQGLEDSWSAADPDYSMTYQNLPPGRYQFQVRVKDQNGNIVGSAQSSVIVIKPPFWQRWWAIVLAALLVVASVYAMVKRRINSIRRKAMLQQQITELEAKALRAQMNPHFIFNSLNAIQELVVTSEVDAAYDYLSKFSKLLRLVLNHSEKSLIPLVDELHMLRLYLELESLRFRRSFHYNIAVNPDIDAELVMVPPLLIQPFIENALWHGLMLKEGERQLTIRVSQQDKQVICEVLDNGIGRKKAEEIKAQKLGAAHFESKGLRLSQHRIQLLSAEGRKGEVKIEDLYHGGTATGTRVLISLPFIQA